MRTYLIGIAKATATYAIMYAAIKVAIIGVDYLFDRAKRA